MIIKKRNTINWLYYYYTNNKLEDNNLHGLFNSWYDVGIGYNYHRIEKGFWLMNKNDLYS